MTAEDFVQKNSRYIWLLVRKFALTHDKLTFPDLEDMYQEIVTFYITKITKTNSDDNIRVSRYDAMHVMCAYVQRMLLPVHVPHNTGNYSRDVRTYKSVSRDGILRRVQDMEPDAEFVTNVRLLFEQLNETERQVLKMAYYGSNSAEIAREIDIPAYTVRRIRDRIARRYSEAFRQ